MTTDALRTYRSFRVPVDRVWPHLSRPELLAGWLGAADFELLPGGAARVKTWNGDEWAGRVTAASPPVRLEFVWRLFEFEEEHAISWSLEGDGPGSRLNVTHENLRSPEEKSHARLTWREALESLHAAVGGGPRPEWGGTIPIVIRTSLHRPAADLWPLFTTRTGLAKWIAEVQEFDPAPGGAFRFRSRYQGREVIEEGRVEELISESRLRLAWEWRGEEWGSATSVEFTLEPRDGGTSLLFVHSGFERIAPERAVAARRTYATGWAGVLHDLARLLSPAPAA
ncbi:MAG TPA: SRPBCC domain-containing protein [Candidatus Eisenbacteria bacterium]|jgi:uncharacterized protein YndB with AHSA1/START domain